MKDAFVITSLVLLSLDFAMRIREAKTEMVGLIINGGLIVFGVAAILGG